MRFTGTEHISFTRYICNSTTFFVCLLFIFIRTRNRPCVVFSCCLICVLGLSILQYPENLRANIIKPFLRMSVSVLRDIEEDQHNATFNCSHITRRTGIEDLLCKKQYKFIKNFKNPCWYESIKNESKLRCFPYFHIFGVCKSGTTDLFHRLIKHPQIIGNKGALSKEVSYWAWRRYGKLTFKFRDTTIATFPVMSLKQYINYFDSSIISSKLMISNENGSVYSDMITGQGDPMDFWDQSQWKLIPQNNISADEPTFTLPHLLKHIVPDIKLILVLRDPVERLYSHYFHGSFGNNSVSFHRDILRSIKILDQCQINHSLRSCLYNQTIMNMIPTPIYASFYYIHLEEWLKVFPWKQLFIMRTEDYASNIQQQILELFKYLGVRDVSVEEMKVICNEKHEYKTGLKYSAGPMSNATRIILRKYFRKPNEDLAKLLQNNKYLWNDME